MTGPELQSLIHTLTPFSAAVIDQTFRALRMRDLVPTSPRGGTPIHMARDHAAWIILALAIDRAPAKAAELVATWGAMVPTDDRSGFPTFGQALAASLSDDSAALRIWEIRVCRDWPRAEIVVGEEGARTTYVFGFTSVGEARAAGFRTAPCRSEFVVSGGALQALAIDLADHSERKAQIVG